MKGEAIKAKGDELIQKFYEAAAQHNFSGSTGWVLDHKQTLINARQCAIIAVEEIMKVMDSDSFYAVNLIEEEFIPVEEYWNEVLNYLKSKL